MAEGQIKLSVTGNVDLSDLRVAVDALVELLDDLVGHEPVTWDIRRLSGGSLQLECEGKAETDEGQQRVNEAAKEYDRLGKIASHNLPLDDYPDEVIDRIAAITSLIRENKATSVVMSSNGNDWTINAPVDPAPKLSSGEASMPLRTYVRTSIRGRVSAVNDMASYVYFTLEEADTKRKFRCWAPVAFRPLVWKCGGDEKWITVEGRGSRTATPNPTITDVTDIFVHDDYEPGDWRQAIGCLG